MKTKNNINGIILAGGQSRRMGQSKAFMEFQGKPFIQYCIDALKPLVNEIIVVSDDVKFDTFEIQRINDEIKNAGPLAGLYTGLKYSEASYNLVLSCDVPCIETSILQKLIDTIDPEIDVVQTESEGNTHPLIAVYQNSCALKLKNVLDQGERSLRIALNGLNSKTIQLNGTEALHLRNINTPKEYKALKYEVEH